MDTAEKGEASEGLKSAVEVEVPINLSVSAFAMWERDRGSRMCFSVGPMLFFQL